MSWCWLLGHVHRVHFIIDPSRRVVSCHKCRGRWIMIDEQRAFLRYDDDPLFKEALVFMYPKLRWLEEFKYIKHEDPLR